MLEAVPTLKPKQQHGGIYTLKLGTGTAAVITSRRLVKQLVDKKSSLYSERPKSYVAKLISGGDRKSSRRLYARLKLSASRYPIDGLLAAMARHEEVAARHIHGEDCR